MSSAGKWSLVTVGLFVIWLALLLGIAFTSPYRPENVPVASCCIVDLQLTQRAAVEKFNSLVVGIEANVRGERYVVGTGLVVRPTAVLTARHIAQLPDLKVVQGKDVREVSHKIEAFDNDLALLWVTEPFKSEPIELDKDIWLGKPCLTIGRPLARPNTVSGGVVSMIDAQVPNLPDGCVLKDLVQFDAPCNPGSSGGPLFSLDGELIGMVSCFNDQGVGFTWAVPAKQVQAFLAAHPGD